LLNGGTLEHAQTNREPRITQDNQALRSHPRGTLTGRDGKDQNLIGDTLPHKCICSN
jgi:hypothetical protein